MNEEFDVKKIHDRDGSLLEIILTNSENDRFRIGRSIIAMFENSSIFVEDYLNCFYDAFRARELVKLNYKHRIMNYSLYTKLMAKSIILCINKHQYPEEIFDEATYDEYLRFFIKADGPNSFINWYRIFHRFDD